MNKQAVEIAIKLIKEFEGCRLVAYQCPAGIWTIGYGETRGVKKGDVWTSQKADTALRDRVEEFMLGIIKVCPQLDLEPSERIAACISLAYNIGLSAFAKSTVCKMIGNKAYPEAADAFLMWDKVGGKPLKGLTDRRQAERKVFLAV